MDDVVVLHGVPVSLSSADGKAFVADATRAGEGVISDDDLKFKYSLSDSDLTNITQNAAVARAVRSLSESRIRSGQAAKEAALKHYARAPQILNSIMSNEHSNAGHRIDAAKTLRLAAGIDNADKEAPANAADKFLIVINMGADTARYEFPVNQLPANNDKTIDADANWGWKEVNGSNE
jgi:hypothetical protein